MILQPFVTMSIMHVDDRGSVYCSLDEIGRAAVPRLDIKRTYIVHNWEKGRIRAWHGHRNGWTGLHVIHGAAKIVAVPISEGSRVRTETESLSKVLSDKNTGILWVPPGYFNGHVSLEDNTKILVYSTHTFEEVKNDDVRCELEKEHIERYFEVKNR